jgi:hypothetical protein
MRCPADKWRHGTNGDMGNMDICGLMPGQFMIRESWEPGKRETYMYHIMWTTREMHGIYILRTTREMHGIYILITILVGHFLINR